MKTRTLIRWLRMVAMANVMLLPMLLPAAINTQFCTNCQIFDTQTALCVDLSLSVPHFINTNINGDIKYSIVADVYPSFATEKPTYTIKTNGTTPDNYIDGNGVIHPAPGVDKVTIFATLISGTNKCVVTSNDFNVTACGYIDVGCGCNGGGDVSVGLSSVVFSMPLGKSLGLTTAGVLKFKSENITTNCGSPKILILDRTGSGVSSVRNLAGTLLEVHAPDTHINIVTNSATQYELRIYKTDFRNYSPDPIPDPATKFVISFLAAGSGDSTNRLQILKWQTNQLVSVYEFSQSTNLGAITLSKGNGTNSSDLPSRQTLSVNTNSAGDRVKTFTLKDLSGNKVQEYTETWRTFAWGQEELIQRVDDPAGAKLTNTYAFYTNAALPTSYARSSTNVSSSGSWSINQYYSSGAASGYLAKVYSGFLNQAPTTDSNLCRVINYDYTTQAGDVGLAENESPRTTVETLLGHEMSRSYTVIKPGERLEIRCQTIGAGWDAADNLVTRTLILTNGQFASQPWKVIQPDGTMTFYSYQVNGLGGTTTTVTTGQPDGGGATIVSGTRTETVLNETHQTMTNTVTDVASGLVIDRTEYSNFDSENRPQLMSYLDGTTHSMTYSCCGVETETDRQGTSSSYVYDALKHRTHTLRDGITTIVSYDVAGRVLATTRKGLDNSEMLLSTNAYDVAGRLTASWNPASGLTTMSESHTVSGQTVNITTDAAGGSSVSTNALDGSNLTITGTSTHGSRNESGVEQDGGIWRAYTKQIKLNTDNTDSGEWVKTYTDMLGRSYKTVYPDGAYSQTFYNSQGQMIKQRDPDGVVTLFRYNAKGEQSISAVDVDQNDTIDFGGSDRITYTTNYVTAARGFTVQRSENYVWPTNSVDAPLLTSVSERAVDGQYSWSSSFGLTNTNATAILGSGLVSRSSYTPYGTYSVSYSLNGRTVATTNFDAANGVLGWTTNSYDAHNRLFTVTDGRNGTSSYTYKAETDLTESTTTPPPTGSGSGLTTTTTYDVLGRAVIMTQPDGTSVTNVYNLLGERTLTFGSRTYPVQYTYDYAGRMKTMTTWTNFASTNGAAVTTWNYDTNRGWLASKRYDDNQGPDYTYTLAGRLATRLWARTVGANRLTTTYLYNNAGDLSTVSYNDGLTPAVTNTYTRRGQLNTVARAGMTSTYAYSDAGQQLFESYSGGLLNGLSITNGYDALLRRTNLAALSGSSQLASSSYGYDAASRLQSVSDDSGHSATYGYLSLSPLVENITFKTAGTTRLTTTKTYDYVNRLTQIASVSSGSFSNAFTYTYNTASQRTAVTNELNERWNYQYDFLGQVTNAWKYDASGSVINDRRFGYRFDDIGNRNFTDTGLAGGSFATTNYTANRLNQYTAIGSTSPQYDADGNMLNDGQRQYGWDGENRLVSVTNRATSLLLAYDSQSRRIQKIVNSSGTPVSTNRFIYDGWNLIGVLTPDTQLLSSYMWGTDLSGSMQGAGGVGGLLAMNDATLGTHFYTYDGNGNVMATVSAADGSQSGKWEYGAFGEALSSTGALANANPYLFSTKFYDSETGLYYYGYRYYEPSSGRWPSRDPIGEGGGTTLYGFVNNRPMIFQDIDGLYILSFDAGAGWWTGSSKKFVQDAYDRVRADMPNIQKQIQDGIDAANDLPDCCAYKKELLVSLNHLKINVDKVKTGIDGNSKLSLTLQLLDPTVTATVPRKFKFPFTFYFPEEIDFNYQPINNDLTDFFQMSETAASERLLHEMTHFSSTADTNDDDVGFRLWNNGAFYQNLYGSGLKNWGGTLLNEIRKKTGKGGCPDPGWPNNK